MTDTTTSEETMGNKVLETLTETIARKLAAREGMPAAMAELFLPDAYRIAMQPQECPMGRCDGHGRATGEEDWLRCGKCGTEYRLAL